MPLPEQRAAAAATSLWCLVCGEYGGVDVLNNILLFIPIGMGLRLSGLGTLRVVAFGALLSLTVEALQFAVIPGRDASLSDVLTNTFGSWAGAFIGRHLRLLLYPTATQGLRLLLAGGLTWLAVQAGTAALLRPWAPDGIRGGAWARVNPGRIPFDGQVTLAVVSGIAVPPKLKPVPELAHRVRQGDVRLEVRLLSGTRKAVWSPVFEVLGRRGSVMSLEAVGADLAFQPPMQSLQLRLRRPALRLDSALPAKPGIPLWVAARGGDTLSATWSVAGGKIFRSLQVLGPSLGWSLITPVSYAFGPETRWITAVWLAGWLTVIGYWSAAARARLRFAAPGLILLAITGLALVPSILGYAVSHWSEWLAAGAGITAGYAGHHFAAYLGERCDFLSIKEFC